MSITNGRDYYRLKSEFRFLTLTLGIKMQMAKLHPFHDASDTSQGGSLSPSLDFSGSQIWKVVLSVIK